jgi:L-alanine-DL-glutamate epimerase-like enolase superfamily enzyme
MAPAASHAVECALLDLQSRLAGVPLRRWILRPRGGTASDWIEVNGALGPAIQVTGEAMTRALDSGYRVLKVKVGCADPDAEIAHLLDLASRLPPGARLRLDANGAWDLETAQRVITACTDLPVESIEEPLRRPDSEGLARLQALAPFPLALDESLVHWTGREASRPFPVRRAVIKPAALGGVAASLRVAERLGGLGVEIVLTGIVESAAGLWATTQVAAAVGSPLAHGLATGTWLAQDLGPPPMPRMGRLHLPDCPGSGFEQFASE